MTIEFTNGSEELQIYRCLNIRMKLSNMEKQYYFNLEKGYEGEQKFAQLLENHSDNWIILRDILLEWNNTYFQIDTLLIAHNIIYLFEVKNYEGDFFIENDIWYTMSKKEIKKPILQLDRCESLLRQLLHSYGITLPIKSYVVFVNPEFSLFQAPFDLPIILPTQINRFMKQLKMNSTSTTKTDIRLAKTIINLNQDKSPFTRIPTIDYNQLKKGITCNSCNSYSISLLNMQTTCDTCGYVEKVDDSILRNVKQFQLLFPQSKITTNTIYDWCRIIKSKKTICRVLTKNYTRIGHGKFTYYVDPLSDE